MDPDGAGDPLFAYDEDKVGKQRKRRRLLKQFGEKGSDGIGGEGLEDALSSKKKKKKKKKRASDEEGGRKEKGYDGVGSKGDEAGGIGDSEMQELWDIIAGGDSEEDQEGVRSLDDDDFTGVDGFGGDNGGGSIWRHPPQAEELDDEVISKLFKGPPGKKSPAELALIVEHLMAELEVTAEEDAELNRQSKPAINKLKKLPLLTDVLLKKGLQQEFLDHGVLTLLKNWLEPLPDGCLPNMNIRTAILQILADFPIDLEQYDRREQLKRSGLGRVIMFLSKSDEETRSNRKLAKEVVDKWSRQIFDNNSTTFDQDMGSTYDHDQKRRRPPSSKMPMTEANYSRDHDIELDDYLSQGPKSGQGASRKHASRPEAMALVFTVRPQSKVDAEQIRARFVPDQSRMRMHKKLQKLKAPKKKSLQASRLSVEGRGMVNYL